MVVSAPAVVPPPSRMPSPPPRELPTGVYAAGLSFALGLASLAWVPVSLSAKTGLPAWPAVSLGLVALLLGWGRHGALWRGIGMITGCIAVIAGSTQILLLWFAASLVSYM